MKIIILLFIKASEMEHCWRFIESKNNLSSLSLLAGNNEGSEINVYILESLS